MPEMTLDHYQDSPSLRVIDALAAATETDPLELDPLYDAVDPEALDRLFGPEANGNATVQFAYDDHAVEIRSDGTVSVDGTVYDHDRA
ncbi:HalOD1 output domain-containing protein [Halopiger djelfimassiliensis]|uniref:HalOD1 output domain-containing protein n=1 Tax=Halopiger djelfimassiliensis TaxID=1293047 RepID=UPI000677F70E|nr:HalOD1 output domain-containing protein [Halopiger djelfimassiliensis]